MIQKEKHKKTEALWEEEKNKNTFIYFAVSLLQLHLLSGTLGLWSAVCQGLTTVNGMSPQHTSSLCLIALIYHRQQCIIYLLFWSRTDLWPCDKCNSNAISCCMAECLKYSCTVIEAAHTHTQRHTYTAYRAGKVMALLITTPLPLLLANISLPSLSQSHLPV